ncbi:MAG TPA: DevR family CRISPR-associated autoregulator [Aggregatilinea sp.]|uniref:DevR family CRISPR-associated autoregulator n=1 Tax=Aggregatilinea sp. TaxID=2806333 RepID=UPI002BC25CB5|nr:DevR family CRISPR-associated autoregulator [Aggregatilinea sp.]HML22998.1 DevR family CRISPR-associated autoregulator [Aggregatilinea sp.]
MTTPITSLSLACRVVMDMHALNNEGNESNRLMTRQVGIVTPATTEDGTPTYARSTVNAISGDMNKHIFADAFRDMALDLGLDVCPACQALDPARMMGNADFREFLKGKPAVDEVIDRLLTCAVDDVCGIMITGEGMSVKRKSAIEFGWTVGLPEITEVQEFLHARHAITRLTRTKATRDSDEDTKKTALAEKGENIGQMVFNRPASSGVYAFVAHLDVAAIGFNDASQDYPDFVTDRDGRLRAALMALVQTVLHPKGALTSTQLPHVVDVEGFVSVSTSAAAAPLISPLADNFIHRANDIAGLVNRIHGENAVSLLPFAGSEGLLAQIADVVETVTPAQYRRL